MMNDNYDGEFNNTQPRFMLAALKSGSGKTTVTCGIIRALQRRGKRVASVKCGPDYIDPMFHRRVLGISAGNIDTFFTDERTCRDLMIRHTREADITVVEGVMGYYDGLGGVSEEASSYHVAKTTETPVILVVDAKGASVTLAALVKGAVDFRGDSNIRGVILNRVSVSYYDRIKSVVEAEAGVRVLGFMPDMEELSIPSRHLGLVMPEELTALDNWIEKTADCVDNYIDTEAIVDIAESAEKLCREIGGRPDNSLPHFTGKIRVAVARDEAFSFYYKENLELLQNMGAELVEFSPMRDKRLPDDIDCMLLGGGYPEIYAGELSTNKAMLKDVKRAIDDGAAVIAECGGFMYLMRELEDVNGVAYPMVGYFDGKAYNTGKLCRFGYVELWDGDSETGSFFMRGHEFHKWDTSLNGGDLLAVKPLTATGYKCMYRNSKLLVGYPHLYYYSNVKAIYDFLEGCVKSGV